MPLNYAGTDTLHNEVQIQSDGDVDNAAGRVAAVMALKDNSVWINNRALKNDGPYTAVGPITITNGITVGGAAALNGGGSFGGRLTPGAAGAVGRRVQSLVDGAATTTIDCRTDYALVNLTSASNGVTRTLEIATTNSPQVGDRIQVQVIRNISTTGELELKTGGGILTIATTDFPGVTADTKDNEACIELVYVGAPFLSWRASKPYNFTIVGA